MNDAFDTADCALERIAIGKVGDNAVRKAGRLRAIEATHMVTAMIQLGNDGLADATG
jgi:hypothetical protein